MDRATTRRRSAEAGAEGHFRDDDRCRAHTTVRRIFHFHFHVTTQAISRAPSIAPDVTRAARQVNSKGRWTTFPSHRVRERLLPAPQWHRPAIGKPRQHGGLQQCRGQPFPAAASAASHPSPQHHHHQQQQRNYPSAAAGSSSSSSSRRRRPSHLLSRRHRGCYPARNGARRQMPLNLPTLADYFTCCAPH